jgi:hypothetical protein
MKRIVRDLGLTVLALGALGVTANWVARPWSPDVDDPTRRWMLLTDSDGDGVLSRAEYAAVSDGVTPMSLIDLNGDERIDAAEVHAFMLEGDPIDWLRR